MWQTLFSMKRSCWRSSREVVTLCRSSITALCTWFGSDESDLHDILHGYRRQIPLPTLTSYWHQMLQVVGYIHERGVIHLDLKPANFLMIRGKLKLIDFGLACSLKYGADEATRSFIRTIEYIS
jgi:serine/threonine protein kinase